MKLLALICLVLVFNSALARSSKRWSSGGATRCPSIARDTGKNCGDYYNCDQNSDVQCYSGNGNMVGSGSGRCCNFAGLDPHTYMQCYLTFTCVWRV